MGIRIGSKPTQADLANRPEFPRPQGVLDAVAAGVDADLNCMVRDCIDCGSKFAGPGPRCRVCVKLRDNSNELLTACEAALDRLVNGYGCSDGEVITQLQGAITKAKSR